jgi:hypothetical protein
MTLQTTSDARARAEHPNVCRVCHGTGWQPGPPIPVQLDGRRFEHETVRPCEHPWWWDDPSPDQPISFGEYRQRLNRRAALGDPEAAAEVALWSRQCPRVSADVLEGGSDVVR